MCAAKRGAKLPVAMRGAHSHPGKGKALIEFIYASIIQSALKKSKRLWVSCSGSCRRCVVVLASGWLLQLSS